MIIIKKNTGMKILKAILQHPRKSDGGIAEIVNVSQPTVTRTRTMLEKEECLTFLAMPNVAKIGYEIVAISHIRMDQDNENILLMDRKVIFALRTFFRGIVTISLHRNYTDYHGFAMDYDIVDSTLLLTSVEPIKSLSFHNVDIKNIS